MLGNAIQSMLAAVYVTMKKLLFSLDDLNGKR